MHKDSNSGADLKVVHQIRLHGPWQAEIVELIDSGSNQAFANQFRLKVPGDWSPWLGHEFLGTVRLERPFGRPTGLTVEQQVWLSIECVDFSARIWLNDVELGTHQLGSPPVRFPVHSLLQARNRLRIEVEMPLGASRTTRAGLAGGILGDVRLEICEP
jgi:beta-mannosidase